MISELTRDRLGVCAAIVFGLGLTTMLYRGFYELETVREQQRFNIEARRLADVLSTSIRRAGDAIQATGRMHYAQQTVTSSEFKIYTREVLKDVPPLMQLYWQPWIYQSHRKTFEARVKAQFHLPDFRIVERSEQGALTPSPIRQYYTPILYAEPELSTKIGLDPSSTSIHKALMELARDVGTLSASVVIPFHEDKVQRKIIYVAYPIYNAPGLLSLEERRAQIKGFATGVIDIEALMIPAAVFAERTGIDFKVYEDRSSSDPSIYGYSLTTNLTQLENSDVFQHSTAIEVFDRRWELLVRPNELFLRHVDHSASLLISVAGTIISIIISLLLYRTQRISRSRLRAQRQLRSMTDDLPLGVFQFRQNPKGKRYFSFLNKGAGPLLGISEQTILEEHSQALENVLPEDLSRLQQGMSDALDWGSLWEDRFRIIKNNVTKWIYTRAQATSTGDGGAVLNGYWQDITELMEQDSAQREAEQRLREITNSLPLAVYQLHVDHEDRLTLAFINNQVQDLLGVKPSDVFKHPEILFRYPNTTAASVATALKEAASLGPRYSSEYRISNSSSPNKWIHLEAVWAPSPRYEGIIWTGFLQDITDKKRQEVELIEAKDNAEEATHAKSNFLANVSHEIRTPMNAIIGMSYLCLNTDLTKKQRDYVQKIHGAGSALLGILNDLLDFSKIEANKIQFEEVEFCFDNVIENLTTVVADRAYEKGLDLLFHIRPEIPPSLIGDPLRLGQVLINLVNNAIKFTDTGTISISTSIIEQRDNQVKLQCSITDTGVGMTMDQCAKLFQPFTQADGSITRKYGGTGLGLTICKRFVEMMDGTIWFDSKLNEGSTFAFTAWLGIGTHTPVRKTIPREIAGTRVLIVDDNAAAREILTEMLDTLKFSVDAVGSGEEAIAAVEEATDNPYSIILLDWKLPGVDGTEVVRKLKAGRPSNTPPWIVMITAYNRDELLRNIDDASIVGVIAKPVSAAQLMDHLAGLFGPKLHPVIASTGTNTQQRSLNARVLVVEDNDINRQIACELLTNAGFTIESAENGREALDKIMKTPSRPIYDAVLMDIQMPGINGFEATRLIREDKRFDNMPIIAMTAHAMVTEREACLTQGMQDHVSKPIDPDELISTLVRWCKQTTPPLNTDNTISSPEILPPIAGLDMEAGLRRAVGNKKLYRQFLTDFSHRYANVEQHITDALATGNKELAGRTAHTLRGVAGNIGASQIWDTAGIVETAIEHNATASEIEHAIRILGQQTRALCAQITAAYEDTTQSSTHLHLNLAEFKPILQNLIRRLMDNDAEAIDEFDTHHDLFSTTLPPTHFVQLKRALGNFEFEQALSILQQFAAESELLLEKSTMRQPPT